MGSVTKTVTADDPLICAQALDPNRWLIPQQHADIPRFTQGNRVEPLIDGQAAFAAMHTAFTATASAEDYIYITGWDLVPAIHLLGRSSPASTVDAVLSSAAGRGVDVRMLIWVITSPFTIAGVNTFMDGKTRDTTGSHHQKTAAVHANGTLTSFVGGIDMTRDRWDTPAHNFPDPNADYKGSGQPWHDVHAKVNGPAAADIETNIRHRWNDTRVVFRPPIGPPIGTPPPAPPMPVHPVPAAVPGGTHIVQTLRTFPHHATFGTFNWPYDFAPTGEFGLRRAYLNAIGNAREYIYIEDQYMISDDVISPAIAAAMRRSPELQVILVTAPEPDTGTQNIKDAFDFHQNRFVANLRAVDASRVQIFHLENLGSPRTPIYCHSKVCIIDDIWAIIGSCNMSTRSLTHDSEISIAVVDLAVEHGRRRFARDLRIALWSEHLGLTPAQRSLIDNPVAGAAEWRSRAGTPPAHAVVHTRPAGSDSILWRTFVDPDGSTP